MDLKLLIEILADGEFHSGEALGERLGITRAAVWKRLQHLMSMDIPVETNKGKGYRILGGLDLLKLEQIKGDITPLSRALTGNFYFFEEIDSTNSFLLAHGGHGDVCFAERQTAGRGRRGREWFSPYGRNIYLSLRWHVDQGVAALEGLSLAVGVLIAETLAQFGVDEVELKWPNDLLHDGRKLGGVLIEVGGDLTGECVVVVGIGLNVTMGDALSEDRISQPWIDLKRLGFHGSRNKLIAALISELLPAFRSFPNMGFAAYRDRWESRCAFFNNPISVLSPTGSVDGQLLGVDAQGGLRVLVDGNEVVFAGGEISLRKRA